MADDRDTIDFVTAFAIGAALGVGAALLLRPSRQTRVQRIMKEIEPYRKKAGKQASRFKAQVSKHAGAAAGAAADSTEEFVSGARHLIKDFRSEMDDIVQDARKELGRAVQDQVKYARKAARRTAKKVRG